MDGNQASYCTVQDNTSQSKFVFYTHLKSGVFRICLTDAFNVWSTEFTEGTLSQFREKFALKSTEDCILKIRSACGNGSLSVTVQDTDAVLHVGSTMELSIALSKLEDPGIKEELKELLFRMADSITKSANAGKCPSVSPVKNQQRRPTEFEPRRQKNGPPVTLKKRLPGDSLINPGTKKKCQATGVAFDDADDD